VRKVQNSRRSLVDLSSMARAKRAAIMRTLVTVCAALFCFLSRPAHAGVLSAVNDKADTALAACLKAHPIPDEANDTDEAATADLQIHMHQCETQFRASLLECRAAGRGAGECSLAVIVFVAETINGR
jgi:hypothetical protein